jgi:hypothetical protein
MTRDEQSARSGLSRRRVLRNLVATGAVGTASVGVASAQGCDLAVEKKQTSGFEYGESGSFEIQVCNVGSDDCGTGLDFVELTDQLPDGLTYVDVESDSWGCELQNGAVECLSSVSVQPGECIPLRINVEVDPESSYPDSQTTNCATVSASADGNSANDEGCTPVCLAGTRTILAGVKDNFDETSGGDTVDPDDALAAWVTRADHQSVVREFDEPGSDKRFGHTFDGLGSDPNRGEICDATLTVRLSPQNSYEENDTIKIGYYEFDSNGDPKPKSPGVKRYIGSGNGEPGLLSDQWSTNNYNTQTFEFDLSAVENADGTTQNFLPAMNNRGTLDLFVQDDTAVDWAELTLSYCCD